MWQFSGCLSVVILWLSLGVVTGDEPKPPATPKANPLQKLLQKIIPPQAPPAAPTAPRSTDPDAADELDERAPKDRKQTDALKKVSAAIEQQDWPTLLDLLQRLLSDKEDSVGRLSPSGWGSVREQALRLMLKLPDEARLAFRQRWDAEAQRQLEAATESNRRSDLVPIALQFLLTDAGQEAADRLANWHFDRGEFVLAARWFRRIEEAQAARVTARAWQLRAAFAAVRAGDKPLAQRWQRGAEAKSDEVVELGGVPVRVEDWWRTLPTESPPQAPLTDWPITFGLSSRSGRPVGGEPLMLTKWQQPLTVLRPMQQRIELMIDDCRDQQLATIPVSQPVFVEGLIALRTLSGVQVWDSATGESLWSAAEDRSAEKLLTSNPTGPNIQINININVGRQGGWNAFGEMNRGMERTDLANSPLANLLFGNGQFGPLSSDGQQLFFVQEDSSGPNAVEPGNGMFRRPQSSRRGAESNRLVSYGLRSGRPLWSIGGAEIEESFQSPLAGVYFFGPPLPDGDELFVIGERDSEIRLFGLDRESGSPLWSQLLAMTAEPISRDLARRQMIAQPALADGIIVCPTTVGWLTAVDRRSRGLLWTYRYSTVTPNRRRNPGSAATVMPPWNDRWRPSVPVIAGDSVVFTPPETEDQNRRQGSIVCLSLQDGTRRWTKLREQNWLTLNGVSDGRVLMLGTRRAAALSLTNGEVLWERLLNNNEGSPSGLGMIVGDRWQVPIGGDQLWTLSLTDGRVLSTQPCPTGIRLGNLHPYRGGVVSVHPTGVTCLEQRDEVLAEITRRREKTATDAVAMLMESALLRLDRKPVEAWDRLAKLSDRDVPPESQARFRQQARDVLFELIEPRPHEHPAELQRLAKLLDSPEDRAKWERLKFDELRGQDDWLAAFRWLQELAVKPAEAGVGLTGAPNRVAQRDVWLSAALAELWRSMPPDVRSEIEPSLISEIDAAAKGNDDVARRRTLRRFAFHAAARSGLWQLANQQLKQNDFTRGELNLLTLTESADRIEAARAWQRLVELYRALELTHDANLAAVRLRTFADTEVSAGTSAAKWVDQELAAGRLGIATQSPLPDWGQLSFQLERLPREMQSNESWQDCTPPDPTWPYFTGERFRFEQSFYPVNAQRFTMTHANDSQSAWALPLRGQPAALSGNVVARGIGHQMLVLHRDVLHLLSPIDQRVIWTQPQESRGLLNVDSNTLQRHVPQQLPTFVQATVPPTELDRRRGSLPHCSPRFVVSRRRQSLTVLDTATGEKQWELQELPSDAAVAANDELLAITSSRWPDYRLFRTADGAIVPLDDSLRQSLTQINRVLGADWLLIRNGTESNQRIVERWNPSRQESRWRQTVAAQDHFTWLDSQLLAILKADGSLLTLDAESGQLLKLGNLPAGKLGQQAPGQQQRYVLADRDRVYLVLTVPVNQAMNSELPSFPINGTIIAFDRQAGGELWRQTVQNKLLVLDQWANSPVLLFAHTLWEAKVGVSTQMRHLLLLDKRTGRSLLDEKIPQHTGGERGLTINLAQTEIQILGIDRLRFIGSPK